MKTPVDLRLRAEARRFVFRFACDDCAHFAASSDAPTADTPAADTPAAGSCSLGFVPEPRCDALDRGELELCKAFELT